MELYKPDLEQGNNLFYLQLVEDRRGILWLWLQSSQVWQRLGPADQQIHRLSCMILESFRRFERQPGELGILWTTRAQCGLGRKTGWTNSTGRQVRSTVRDGSEWPCWKRRRLRS